MTTTSRPGEPVAFTCDACPEAFGSETKNWTDAWAEAKAAGWRASKATGVWEHRCPACVEDGAK